VSQPATLSEVRANDALLRQFDVPGGAAYPVTADMLRQVSARLITHAGFSASRLASLESALPGDYAAVLSDGLARSATREVGLLERIVQAGSEGGWSPEDVAVWDYPERQTAAFHAAGGESAPGLEQIMSILRGPRIVRTQSAPDGGTVRVLSDSSQPLRYVRVQQLRGDLADALTSYGAIRSAYNYEPDAVNQAAADEAAYWIGVCQYELGRYPATIETLQLYRRTWASGTRIDETPFLQALADAQQARFPEAAQVLSEAASAGPIAARDSFLIRRWRARQDRTPASE
jgi:tetratricopeptide (TPR) repeat protein